MAAPQPKPGTVAPLFADPAVTVERREDGTILLSSPMPLEPPVRAVGLWLERWGREAPDRVFLAERPAPGEPWRRVTYGEALAQVRAVATAMLQRRLSPDRPVAILSDNGIDHAILAFGAMHAGVPVASISPAYSLVSSDGEKLRAMVGLLEPGLIYVADEAQYSGALARIVDAHDAEIVASRPQAKATAFTALLGETDDDAVDASLAGVGPDTIARFLFTSGSTGLPKAVVNTQRMLTSNQQSKAATWPFLEERPPVIVDWLPWSHTFGGNHNLNMVLRNGGTLYVDDGKPAPPLIGRTIANLAEVGPTLWFNVPRGFDMALDLLRADRDLARRAFRNLELLFYAGAALPQSVWEALAETARAATGRDIPMVSSWGSTETAPLATDCHFQAERSGNIGNPVPGVSLKMVPNAGKLEVRVKGPSVTPGYWKSEAMTAGAFDDEGYYRIGDAVRFADAARPEAGLFFDGRVSEDFKLTSGTWVSVGDVRVEGISALAPIAQDIVVTGHDSKEVGFLVFPNVPACRRLAGAGEDVPLRAVLDHPAVRDHVRAGLERLRSKGGGSSRYAMRARLMEEPASVDHGEITDKGYVNQRAVLARRHGDLVALGSDDRSAFIAID